VLKLSKEKWDEASAHALQAVQPDFRRRVWYPPGHNMGIGILFSCKYGAVALKDCVMLLQVGQGEGGRGPWAPWLLAWRCGGAVVWQRAPHAAEPRCLEAMLRMQRVRLLLPQCCCCCCC
jgi:hypothetical protein